MSASPRSPPASGTPPMLPEPPSLKLPVPYRPGVPQALCSRSFKCPPSSTRSFSQESRANHGCRLLFSYGSGAPPCETSCRWLQLFKHCLCYHTDISVWLREARGMDAFRMFIFLGWWGYHCHRRLRRPSPTPLPFPTGPLFCTRLRGPCLSPSMVFSFLNCALPAWPFLSPPLP